jgi:AcrR family transcriptional regulator
MDDSNRGRRIERKKEETRKKIISVAMDLFRRQGFDQTTVDQIAEDVDISRMTIFNYFPAKEVIIREYVLRAIREAGPELVSMLEGLPDTRSRITTLFSTTMEWLEVNLGEDLLKKLITYNMGSLFEALKIQTHFTEILEQIIRIGQESGELRGDIPADEISNHLDWISTSIIIVSQSFPEKSLTDLINRKLDLFLNGVINKGD